MLQALGACCKPCTIWQDSRAEPALKYGGWPKGAWSKHGSENDEGVACVARGPSLGQDLEIHLHAYEKSPGPTENLKCK